MIAVLKSVEGQASCTDERYLCLAVVKLREKCIFINVPVDYVWQVVKLIVHQPDYFLARFPVRLPNIQMALIIEQDMD